MPVGCPILDFTIPNFFPTFPKVEKSPPLSPTESSSPNKLIKKLSGLSDISEMEENNSVNCCDLSCIDDAVNDINNVSNKDNDNKYSHNKDIDNKYNRSSNNGYKSNNKDTNDKDTNNRGNDNKYIHDSDNYHNSNTKDTSNKDNINCKDNKNSNNNNDNNNDNNNNNNNDDNNINNNDKDNNKDIKMDNNNTASLLELNVEKEACSIKSYSPSLPVLSLQNTPSGQNQSMSHLAGNSPATSARKKNNFHSFSEGTSPLHHVVRSDGMSEKNERNGRNFEFSEFRIKYEQITGDKSPDTCRSIDTEKSKSEDSRNKMHPECRKISDEKKYHDDENGDGVNFTVKKRFHTGDNECKHTEMKERMNQ